MVLFEMLETLCVELIPYMVYYECIKLNCVVLACMWIDAHQHSSTTYIKNFLFLTNIHINHVWL